MVKKRGIIKNLIFVLCALLTLSSNLSAQDETSFYLDVAPKTGSLEDTFTLSIVLENSPEQVAPNLALGDDFEVKYIGPKFSTNIINGRITTQYVYNYRLYPKREGVLETPSAEIKISGKKYSAGSMRVKVSKDAPQRDPDSAKSVFIEQETSKKTVYIGEQIVHTMTLYASISVYEPSFSDGTFDGFWVEEMQNTPRSNTFINGVTFNVVKIKKALYPVKTGEIDIGGRTLQAKVAQKRQSSSPFGSNDPFDDPFDIFLRGANLVNKTYKSNDIKLTVLPLPSTTETPYSWNSNQVITGQTELSLDFNNNPVKTGESKTFKLSVKSLGNLNPLTALPLKNSEDFKVYEDAAESSKGESASGIITTKVFNFSLVPLKPGEITIPAIKLSYFDPTTVTYKTASTEAITFSAEGKDLRIPEAEVMAPKPESKKDTAPQNPKPSPASRKEVYQEPGFVEKFFAKISLSLILLLNFILFSLAGLIFLILHLVKKAGKSKSLKSAVKDCKDYKELKELLVRHLSEYLRHDYSGVSLEILKTALKNSITDKEILFTFLYVLDKMEEASYSSTGGKSINLEDLKEKSLYALRLLKQ